MSQSSSATSAYAALSTAGAIPVRNEKGEVTMQKVKVQRYVSGRKPKFIDDDSNSPSSESSDEDTQFGHRKPIRLRETIYTDLNERQRYNKEDSSDEDGHEVKFDVNEMNDPRLRRLQAMKKIRDETEEDSQRDRRGNRRVIEPQVLQVGENDEDDDRVERHRRRRDYSSSDDEKELEEENVERRHAFIRSKKDEDDEEEELLAKEESDKESDDDDESEYEEYTDSEDDNGPRLKPVFVRKKDRITIQEKEKEELKMIQEKEDARREAEERKRDTLKMIEEDVRREEQEKIERDEEEMLMKALEAVLTEDENEETAYETWKLRELKRVKRDKDEREAIIKDQIDIERLRNMTEEERLEELKKNPKIITNKANKGKYKFLQKYFHRGAFYLDVEDHVFKRDFAEPTLEDHFDKQVVPKVMQVKNFGRSGRTKYTHLVDQDTTAFDKDSPWKAESAQTSKFYSTQAGGMKQVFERPSGKRKEK